MGTKTESKLAINGSSKGSGHTRSKVKTGCKTCKLRKVKCDESRPACDRCVSSGRVCEGYGIWGGGSSVHTEACTAVPRAARKQPRCADVVVQTNAGLPHTFGIRHVSPAEHECYDWFLQRSTFKLPGLFRSRFWKTTLLQASTSEPAILNAVLALSAIHRSETFIESGTTTSTGFQQDNFTLVHYGTAMKGLRTGLNTDDQATLRVTIIACVVFVYIDFLRGHYQSGLTHLRHGLKLMQQLPISNSLHHRIGTDESETALDWAVEPMLRLYIQAAMMGQLSEPFHPAYDDIATVEVPPIFTSLYHSRCYLDLLLARILYLAHHAPTSTTNSHSTESHLLHHRLHAWHAAANLTLTTHHPTPTLRDRITFTSQLSLFTTALVHLSHLSPCPAPSHTASHHLLLTRAISMYRASRLPTIRQSILGPHAELGTSEPVVDIGWLPGLYFIAVHCRVRRIRHHALRLVRTNAHKEGMWDTRLTGEVMEEVVRVEEGWGDDGETGIIQGFGLLDEPVLEELLREEEAGEVVPAWCRVRDLRVELPEDPRGVLVLRFWRQPGPEEEAADIVRVFDLVTGRWRDGLAEMEGG